MRYPPATWKGDGASGGSYTPAGQKIVLHTTETAGLPSYNGGMSAPHLTYHPGHRSWVQHTDLDVAARSLRNEAGGAQTNRANAYQVEIICYSAARIAARSSARLWVGDLPASAYDDLRDFIEWSGVNPVWPGRQALSASEANAPGFRMAASNWTAFNGIVGHQHVPENTHWDPGALDWSQLLTGESEAVMRRGDTGRAVAEVQHAGAKFWGWANGAWTPFAGTSTFDGARFGPGEDGDYGGTTELNVEAFQASQDLAETGVVDGVVAAMLFAPYGGTGGVSEDDVKALIGASTVTPP